VLITVSHIIFFSGVARYDDDAYAVVDQKRFDNVYVLAWCSNEKGKKMSNVRAQRAGTRLDLYEEYGADAVRFLRRWPHGARLNCDRIRMRYRQPFGPNCGTPTMPR